MVLKSLVLFSVLGLVLLVLLGFQHLRETHVQQFQRQHMDPNNFPSRDPTYCNVMMKRRTMTKGSCKPKNTFVHESMSQVKAVCHQKTVPCRNKTNKTNKCWQSNSRMRITECTWNRKSRPPNCVYRTRSTRKHIIIACRGRPPVPIHFDDSV